MNAVKECLGGNQQLIGKAESRESLSTPALILDLDCFEGNLKKMSSHCNGIHLSLRPHVKGHKSVACAKAQVAEGAVGVCCATIREAEVMTRGGISGVLISSTLTAEDKIWRLIKLNQETDDLMAVVDNSENVDYLAHAAAKSSQKLKLLVDVDLGLGRSGVTRTDQALMLARQIAAHSSLEYAGLQCFAGQVLHLAGHDQRRSAVLQCLEKAHAVRQLLAREDLEPRIVSGGGTGTYDMEAEAGLLTEFQAGSYAFMDTTYSNLWLEEGKKPPFENSLFVQSTVISANHANYVTVDAGTKSMGLDGDSPTVSVGAPKESVYSCSGDEHGQLRFIGESEGLGIGKRVELTVPHCDTTFNLYDFIHCVRGDKLVDIWRIDGRGY